VEWGLWKVLAELAAADIGSGGRSKVAVDWEVELGWMVGTEAERLGDLRRFRRLLSALRIVRWDLVWGFENAGE
jgi:hypothetical protein